MSGMLAVRRAPGDRTYHPGVGGDKTWISRECAMLSHAVGLVDGSSIPATARRLKSSREASRERIAEG